ncbi:MAG: hypothetical protein M1837_004702 [Sclerophora amabilis]|nr:MAG: hypothetical protein M1837_004702 [Sclerophora amabilis]
MPGRNAKRKVDTIDLTASDNDDFEILGSQPGKTLKTTHGSSQGQRARAIDGVEDDGTLEILDSSQDFDDYAYDRFELYGTLDTKIVGVRYYNGRATMGELVTVRREPSNPYDGNAVRIDNVRGDQVGHIPRQMASKLAPYMDSQALLVEGTLTGEKMEFDCPIALNLFGASDPVDKQNLKAQMKRDGFAVAALNRREMQQNKQKAADLKKLTMKGTSQGAGSNQQWETGRDFIAGSSQGKVEPLASIPSLDNIMEESQRINPREVGEVAERFGTGEAALAQMEMAKEPNALAVQLLPFQRQGLAWMLDKENPQLPAAGSGDVVQLWKRSTNDANWFTNIATNYSTKQEPSLASGGILADDMGLGKTIQVISLIIADANRNKKLEKSGAPHSLQTTLIICPVSVMSNWSGQIARHVLPKMALRVLTYHGAGKKQMSPQDFDGYDVVITSYGTLSTEYLPRKGNAVERIPREKGLFSTDWRRVILDEGHTIRNPNSKTAMAASSLIARSRWVLTGTPIINNLKDLFSIVRFLRLTGGLERFEIFYSALIRRLNLGDENGNLLLHALMGTICLRRKKEMAFIDLRLPELSEYVHRINFLPHEKEKYEGLQAEAKGLLDTYRQRHNQGNGKTLQTYHHLLETLLRLRQVCNHWKLCGERITSLLSLLDSQKVVDLNPENRRALQDMLQLSIDSRDECPVCLETLRNPVITACAHTFDFECIERVIETQHRCPLCRADVPDQESLVRPAADVGEAPRPTDIDIDADTSSSKVEALLSILKASRAKPGTKVIVFSQWTSFLNIIQNQLDKHCFKYTRLDGSMSAPRRDAAISSLETDPDCTIMLASLAVCSVGLNLVAANQVILADSWWAPAIEDQAVDRVHRLGQTKPTTVFRLVMEGSIEERVLDIQAEKRKLMMNAFREKSSKRSGGRTTRDIENLLA